jgi:hypothetical protein
MTNKAGIAGIVQEVRREMEDELRQRVREAIADRPREWLVEQLLDLAVAPGLPAQRAGRPPAGRATEPEDGREARMERVRALSLDVGLLRRYVPRYRELTRQALIEGGLLLDPPPKGSSGLIGAEHRTPAGEALLREAKDLLHALLFGDEEGGVRLDRVERELLTLTVPRGKAHAISSVLRAATEIRAQGTWRDPQGAAHDERAPNTVFQVEYGEVAEELVGNGVAACLKLINELEVNEQVLYGRMENVEESTLA